MKTLLLCLRIEDILSMMLGTLKADASKEQTITVNIDLILMNFALESKPKITNNAMYNQLIDTFGILG